MPLPKADLFWIAGFYEGEGCAVCFETRPHQWTLTVSITQKENQILNWIKAKYGFGSVIVNQKGCHHWQCYFNNAKVFLESILPYMKVDRKIEQAKLALNLAKQNIKHGRMTGLPTNSKLNLNQVKEIKKRYGILSQVELATLFGITQPSISKIINNKQWTYVTTS